jgi:NADH-quinone oxidoreductase subunit B
MGVEQKLGNMGVVTTTLEQVVNWSRTRAMWPMLFGLACCAIEMMSAQAAHYDMSRFGMELMRASPRQSDLMIVAGRVSRKMGPVLRRLYDQMPEPKWVLAMGDCASCGGVFNNYAIYQGWMKWCRWMFTWPAARRAPKLDSWRGDAVRKGLRRKVHRLRGYGIS